MSLVILTIVMAFGTALALGYAAINFYAVKRMDEGTERMQEIAKAIRIGANTFINYEYRIVAIIAAIIAVVLGVMITDRKSVV